MKGRSHLIPSLFAAICLLAALLDWPYGYYVFLRIVVCIAALFVIATAYESRQTWAIWLWGTIAVLFNPIIKIPLSRETWQPIDLVCAVLFVIGAIIIKRTKQIIESKNDDFYERLKKYQEREKYLDNLEKQCDQLDAEFDEIERRAKMHEKQK